MKTIFYDWGGANLWLFHVINDVRGGFIDGLMQLGSTLGAHGNFPIYLSLIALVATLLTARAFARDARSGREQALGWLAVLSVLGVAYVIDGLAISWLKATLDFPRPPAALPPGTLHVVGTPELRHSLPSGHAAFATTLAASLWPALHRPGRIGLAVFVLWVGLSRVSLGMHFPADVVAGVGVGLLVVVPVRLAIRRVLRFAVS